jgi:hypothetical protein
MEIKLTDDLPQRRPKLVHRLPQHARLRAAERARDDEVGDGVRREARELPGEVGPEERREDAGWAARDERLEEVGGRRVAEEGREVVGGRGGGVRGRI